MLWLNNSLDSHISVVSDFHGIHYNVLAEGLVITLGIIFHFLEIICL